jgi:hypothetical protein
MLFRDDILGQKLGAFVTVYEDRSFPYQIAFVISEFIVSDDELERIGYDVLDGDLEGSIYDYETTIGTWRVNRLNGAGKDVYVVIVETV